MESVYLSCAEVAEMLGVTTGTVRKWCGKGMLKAIKPTGKNLLIKREDLEAFLENKQEA